MPGIGISVGISVGGPTGGAVLVPPNALRADDGLLVYGDNGLLVLWE